MGFIMTFSNILLWLTPFLVISLVHLCCIIPSNSDDAPIAALILGAFLHLATIFIIYIKTPAPTPTKYTIQFIVSAILNLIVIIRLGFLLENFNNYIEYFYETNSDHTINIHITFDQFTAISATNPNKWTIKEDKLTYDTSKKFYNYDHIGFKTYFDYLKYARMLESERQEAQNMATVEKQTRIINSWLADIEADKARAQIELQNAIDRIKGERR